MGEDLAQMFDFAGCDSCHGAFAVPQLQFADMMHPMMLPRKGKPTDQDLSTKLQHGTSSRLHSRCADVCCWFLRLSIEWTFPCAAVGLSIPSYISSLRWILLLFMWKINLAPRHTMQFGMRHLTDRKEFAAQKFLRTAAQPWAARRWKELRFLDQYSSASMQKHPCGEAPEAHPLNSRTVRT